MARIIQMTAVNPVQQQMFELSGQLTETVNSLKLAEANLIALDAERKRQQLTLMEVSTQDDAATLYKPVGRAYLVKNKDEILFDLNNGIRRNEQEAEELLRKKEVLAKKRDEIAANIQELVASIRS
jgi:chaperonin cofactor prefoldin